MPKPKLTLDELTQTIVRSNLPTIVTEGIDDYIIYRRFENKLEKLGVSLLPAGGRDMVLQLFENRKKFGRNDVAFIVDKDLWVFTGIPSEYTHRKIVTTDGYSIENDLYRDGNLEKFLDANEQSKFRLELESIIRWFSFAAAQKINKADINLSDHPNKILGINGDICPKYLNKIGFTPPNEDFYRDLIENYRSKLRGKNLIDLLCRHTSSTDRAVKIGKKQLLEFCVVAEGEYYTSIEDKISQLFKSF